MPENNYTEEDLKQLLILAISNGDRQLISETSSQLEALKNKKKQENIDFKKETEPDNEDLLEVDEHTENKEINFEDIEQNHSAIEEDIKEDLLLDSSLEDTEEDYLSDFEEDNVEIDNSEDLLLDSSLEDTEEDYLSDFEEDNVEIDNSEDLLLDSSLEDTEEDYLSDFEEDNVEIDNSEDTEQDEELLLDNSGEDEEDYLSEFEEDTKEEPETFEHSIEEDTEQDEDLLLDNSGEDEEDYLSEFEEDREDEEQIEEEHNNYSPEFKLIKWSTTNLKNICNYEEDLHLLKNEEFIFLLKSSKTNILSNNLQDDINLNFLKHLNEDFSNTEELILKMHKYYLICISLGLIQKKVLLEKQAYLNFLFIQEELEKLKDFKTFLLDFSSKQEEFLSLVEIEEYFEKIKKVLGA